MKKQIKILLLLSLLACKGFGQFGEQWIDFDRQYLKVSVVRDGFCRLTPNDFLNAGQSLAGVDPRSFQVIRRGKPCSIRVTGDQDGQFNGTDYLEFYAVKNDANDEKDLYFNGAQTHTYYSNYTDTASYFITWGGLSSPKINVLTPSNQVNVVNTVQTETLQLLTESYNVGNEPVQEIYYSEGDFGEGFFSTGIRNGTNRSIPINLPSNISTTDSIELEVMMVGEYRNTRKVIISISSDSKTQIFETDNFSEFRSNKAIIKLPKEFASTSLGVVVAPIPIDGRTDFISIAYVKVKYSINANWNTSTQSILFQLAPNSKFTPSLASGLHGFYLLEDDDLLTQLSSNTVVQNESSSIKKFLYRPNMVFLSPSKIVKARFSSLVPDANYLLITHDSLWTGALAYKAFKESNEGGNRSVALYNIEELYNTFSYGDKNPLAIRRMAQKQLSTGSPKALMILGKGVTPGYAQGSNYYRQTAFKPTLFNFFDFVPTFGMPGSDVCFTQGLNGYKFTPAIPTGRLTASTNETVLAYVNKLKEHSLLTNEDDWTKNFLHLSGGKTSQEAEYFYTRMDNLKKMVEKPFMGARVHLFAKKTNLPVELYNVSKEVNEGLSMISYMGHSAPNTIEIDLGDASDPTNGYRNQGKYPILFINGCNSLDVFNSATRAENWVNTPNRGAIAAFGHSRYAYTSTLDIYSQLFYETAFNDSLFWGKTIGEIQTETIRKYAARNNESHLMHTHLQQWSLIGDPDIRFMSPSKPDYFFKSPELTINSKLENERLTASSDSLVLSFDISNRGLVKDTVLKICVTRYYDEYKKSIQYPSIVVKAPAYSSKIELTLFNKIEGAEGENLFQVNLDCDNVFDEFNEQNNVLQLTYDMPSNGLQLLYPYPYAIERDKNIEFAVQSQDSKVKSVNYILELANDHLFQSVRERKVVKADNLAIFRGIDLSDIADSTTLYWRSRFESVKEGEDTVWYNSSFTYIESRSGWGQFEYGQFRENGFERIRDDGTKLIFDSVSAKIQFSAVGSLFPEDYIYNTSIIVNDRTILESLWHSGCNAPGFVLLPIDGATLQSYKGASSSAYTSCGLDPKTTAYFRANNTGQMNNMRSYLENIKMGDYLILLSTSNNSIQSMPQAVKDQLHLFGCFSLDTLQNGTSYLFVGKKGKSLPMYEKFDLDKTVKIEDVFLLKDLASKGEIKTVDIGVSNVWSTFDWKSANLSNEFFQLDILAQDTLVLYSDTLSLVQNNQVDTIINDHKTVKLKATLSDILDRSLSDVNHWAFTFDFVPEGVVVPEITPNTTGSFYQGDSVYVTAAFVNVSSVSFDSVWAYVLIKNPTKGLMIEDSVLLNKLNPADTLLFSKGMQSDVFVGDVFYEINFNPKKQLEQFYTNNTFYGGFNVKADEEAPLVEVLLNGQIPIANALAGKDVVIDLRVIDSNPFYVKNDTLGIELFLSGPCVNSIGCDLKPIYFSNPLVKWSQYKGVYQVSISLKDLKEGSYVFKAFGADAFGNVNSIPSEITFLVESQTSLSAFLPYPSPFSSEMRFAYQMNGSKQPNKLHLQIINSTGNLVYEATQTELGELEPGSNLTNWVYRGVDMRGNQLPNGVYLYKVIVSDSEILHLETAVDKSFKDGWGSFMIVR